MRQIRPETGHQETGQSALLLPVPAAEPAVGRHRARLDASARDGVPALLVAWLAAVQWGGTAGAAAVAAAALLIVSVIMSVTLLVPINNRIITWTADNHPADWRELHQRWDRLHYARVAIIIAAFVLTLVAGTAG